MARLLRLGLAVVVYLGLTPVLSPRGLGWVPIVVALGIVGGGLVLERLRAGRDLGARAEKWARAALDPAQRDAAIAKMREMLADPKLAGTPAQLRLAVAVADWLAIDGKPEQAEVLLSSVDTAELSADDAAALLHGRVLLRLRAGDGAGAQKLLENKPARVIDPAVAMRLELLSAATAVELGEYDTALVIANDVARRGRSDGGLVLEARLLRASVLDAQNSRAEARAIVDSLGADVRKMISVVALPRIKALLEKAA